MINSAIRVEASQHQPNSKKKSQQRRFQLQTNIAVVINLESIWTMYI